MVHMNIIFRPKSRKISEVNLKGGWVSCGRKRWSASPALGPLVIFLSKERNCSLRYFCAGYPGNILSVIHGTEPIDWFAVFIF